MIVCGCINRLLLYSVCGLIATSSEHFWNCEYIHTARRALPNIAQEDTNHGAGPGAIGQGGGPWGGPGGQAWPLGLGAKPGGLGAWGPGGQAWGPGGLGARHLRAPVSLCVLKAWSRSGERTSRITPAVHCRYYSLRQNATAAQS